MTAAKFELDRRQFLEAVGGGLLVCLWSPVAAAQESGRARFGHELPKGLDAWIHVARDGRVTAMTGKVEVGQNARTSLTQQIAEELRVAPDAIRLVMGDTDLTPWDAGTFGSRTTPTMGPQLRAVARTAREELVDLAARRWNVGRARLVAEDGRIRDPETGATVSYGELTEGRNFVKNVDATLLAASAEGWKIAGTTLSKRDGAEFVTGRHRYAADLSRPGMLHAKVLRPPSFKATLVSADMAAAARFPGVHVLRDGDFVGVAAPDVSTAERALAAVKAEWKELSGQPSDARIYEYLKEKAERAEPEEGQSAGSSGKALAGADVRLAATYTVAYIAHAPLEPRAALADWSHGRLTVWTGTQRPFAVKDEVADALKLPAAKVRVIVPDTGSAYGGKHMGDAAVEAARLARAAGRPVKIVWTREEEFTWAYFRPAGVIDVSAGASRDGKLVAWEFHNYNSGPAGIRTPYDVADREVLFHLSPSPLRQGSYRGLAATANHFARECHMDDVARALALDPLEFRRRNLSDARLRAVLDAAADRFGWGRPPAASGRGAGLACGVEKGGYVATCAEVSVDPSSRRVRIERVVEAFECGAVINPDGLRNQIEGAIVQGLGGALFEAVRFGGGRIANPHFAQYRVPRFPDAPPIEIVVLERKDLPPAGAGETPIVGIAPAISNAILAATGVRLRRLPMIPDGIVPPAQALGGNDRRLKTS